MSTRRAFTRIELLVLVAGAGISTVIALAIVYRTKEPPGNNPWRKEFLNRLAFACKAYAKDNDDNPPAIADDPLNTGLTPGRISGCQELRLALGGYSLEDMKLVKQNQGSAVDPKNYFGSTRHTYVRWRPNEILPHGQLLMTNKDGTDPDVEVLVDSDFSPPRPILYCRLRQGQFHFEDNAVYFTKPAETKVNWEKAVDKARKAGERFILIWAGPDREFFTKDDFTSLDY